MSNTERGKKFPVGIESFKDIRKEGFYYIDKTIMISAGWCFYESERSVNLWDFT